MIKVIQYLGTNGLIELNELVNGTENSDISDFKVSQDGTIYINGNEKSKIAILKPAKTSDLERHGNGYFKVDTIASLSSDESSKVHQGFYEKGNVQPLNEMVDMMQTMQLFESQQKAMRTTDELLGKITSQLEEILNKEKDMFRALSTAALGMSAQQRSVDNIANNLANVGTTGFKRTTIAFQDLFYEKYGSVSTRELKWSRNYAPELQIGHGAPTVATIRNFMQGSVSETGNALILQLVVQDFSKWKCQMVVLAIRVMVILI